MADYNIAMGIKQPEPVNYLGQMAQVMGIRALQDELQGSESVRSAIQGGMSPTDAKLLQYGKRGEAVYKAGLAGEKESLAATKSRLGLLGQLSGNIIANPTPENLQATLAQAVQYGLTTPQEAQAQIAKLGGDPAAIKTWGLTHQRSALDAEKQLPKIETKDFGGTVGVLSIDPVTGLAKKTYTENKTISPDTAASVGATIRGQDLAEAQRQWERANPTIHYGETTDGMIGMPTRGPNANIATPVYVREAPPLNALAPKTNTPTTMNALAGGATDFTTVVPPDITAANIDLNRAKATPVTGAPQAAPGYTRAVGTKGLTEVQAKSTGFANRAAQAHAIINSVGANGEVQPGLLKRSLEAVPLIGEGLGTMANITQTDPEQQVEQAQRNFVNAILRQESGAAINQSEFDNARKQYFPQPGDGPKVIEQKKQNREMAIKSLEIAAGPGIKKTKVGAADDPLGLR